MADDLPDIGCCPGPVENYWRGSYCRCCGKKLFVAGNIVIGCDRMRDEVIELGLAFDMVTAYTSLVAVEERISAEGPSSSRAMAAVLPQGGTAGPLRLLLGALLGVAGVAVFLLARLAR